MHVRLSSLTRGLVVASTVVIGTLAGGGLDRVIVGVPAWQQVGVQAWADYSRHADLGRGLIAYPLEGVGGAVLALAAAVTFSFAGRVPRAAGPPIYLTAACMIGVMAATAKAAPVMLGVPGLGSDRQALTDAFDQFTFWGLQLRGALAVLAFLASVWAVAAVFRSRTAES